MNAMRIIPALIVMAATTGGAAAACPIAPDGAATRYVENQQALLFCQNGELRDLVRDRQLRLELQQQLRQIESDMRRQQSFVLPVLPRVTP